MRQGWRSSPGSLAASFSEEYFTLSACSAETCYSRTVAAATFCRSSPFSGIPVKCQPEELTLTRLTIDHLGHGADSMLNPVNGALSDLLVCLHGNLKQLSEVSWAQIII